MTSQFALEYLALAVAFGGLFAVVGEILVKDPSLFGAFVGGKAAQVRRGLAEIEAGSIAAASRRAA